MELRTRHYNDRLDAATAPSFLQAVRGQVEDGYGRLVIDLKKVDFLSSAGIKALLQTVHLSRQQGGDMRLANARGRVKYVLNLAGVDSIIKLYPNVVSATASFFPGPLPERW